VRRKPRTALLALAIAALAPSLGLAQYAPKWLVGDWWEVKTWCMSPAGGYAWAHTRSKVKSVEEVAGRECYVIETRNRLPSGSLGKCRNVWYVRKDDWLVVRQVIATTFQDTLRPPVTTDAPLGMFGPFQGGEPRLPGFPLDSTHKTDTLFRLRERYDGPAVLREIVVSADSAFVNRMMLEAGDDGGRVQRPSGVVYLTRDELAGNATLRALTKQGTFPGARPTIQSLQLWGDSQPWRVYEELVVYGKTEPTREIVERSWLTASGREGKGE